MKKYGIKFDNCIYKYSAKYFCFDEGLHRMINDISTMVMFNSKKEAKDYAIKIINNGWYGADLKGYSTCSIIEVEYKETECFNIGFYK